MKEDSYCLYAHQNLTNNKVYIGISKNVKKRWRNKEKGYLHCDKIYNAFQKYGWDGFSHIVIEEGLSKEEACAREHAMIFLFKFSNMSYNITDGGEGTVGVKRSEKHKQILRDRMTGRVVSEETRKKLSKTHSEQCTSRKKIYAFSIETKDLVMEYPSIKGAAKDIGISMSNLIRAANGGRPSAGGYIWSFEPFIDKNNPIYARIDAFKPHAVYCYDLYGNFVKRYNNSTEAAIAVNGSYKGINHYSKKGGTAYCHFLWRKELCEIEPEVLKKIRFKRHETN
jgi:group I intron endonuclease